MKKNTLTCLGLSIVFILVWGVYLKTLSPTLYVGDSGELVTAGYRLGIPHPPGFPLYVLTGRLFSLLPLGEIALRFNLLSAFFASLALVGFAYYLHLLFDKLSLAITLSLIWAWGRAYWEMAGTIEVYQLVNFLFVSLLIILLQGKMTGKRSWWYLSAFIFSLGLSSHYSFIFLALGISLYLLQASLPKKLVYTWPLLLAMGLLGWLIFTCLPLRAVKQPWINWGNPLNLGNFINHITIKEHKIVNASRGWRQFSRQFYYLFLFVKQELPLFSGFVAFLGLGALFRKHPKEFWLFGGMALLMILGGAFTLNYNVLRKALGLGAKFFFPLYLILTVFLGALLQRLINLSGRYGKYLLITTLMLPLSTLFFNYPLSNLREHRVARYFGEDLLITPSANATLLIEEEINELFTLCYLVNVLEKRSDLKVFGPYGNLFSQSYSPFFDMAKRRPPNRRYRSQVEKWARQNIDFQRVFYTLNPYADTPSRSAGLLSYPVKAPPPSLPPQEIWKYYHHDKDWSEVPLNYYSRIVLFTYPYRLGEILLKEKRFAAALRVLAFAYPKIKGIPRLAFNLGVIFQENELYDKALAFYQDELALGIPNRGVWINLGVIYEKLNRLPKALAAYEQAIAIQADPVLMNSVAYAYYQLGDYQKARDLYERVIMLQPHSADIAFKRALNMMKLDKKLAIELWQKFIVDFQGKTIPELLERARHNLQKCQKSKKF